MIFYLLGTGRTTLVPEKIFLNGRLNHVILFLKTSMAPYCPQHKYYAVLFAVVPTDLSNRIISWIFPTHVFYPSHSEFLIFPRTNNLTPLPFLFSTWQLSSSCKFVHSVFHLTPSILKNLSQIFAHLTHIPAQYPARVRCTSCGLPEAPIPTSKVTPIILNFK